MKDSYTRSVRFEEDDIKEWCDKNVDPNPIHTNEEAASESTFGQRVVPGMMLLDHVSGMLTYLGEHDEEIILAGITAARFRDPVLLGETVDYKVEVVDSDKRFTYVDFEARVEERGSLVATGSISIVVN
jgi:acyl dehydratase